MTWALGLVAVGIWLCPGLEQWLVLDRDAVLDGQVWRLVTGHWTHASGEHLLWDVIAFVALGWWVRREGARYYWLALLVGAVTVGAGFLAFEPELPEYRGLSGLCSTFVGVLVYRWGVRAWRERSPLMGPAVALALVTFTAKVIYEFHTSGAVFVSAAGGMVPVPLAHAIGVVAGAALCMGIRCMGICCAGDRRGRVSRLPQATV